MDALEFVKQFRRMDENSPRKYSIYIDSPEDVVSEVEELAKEHPIKTRQSVFLEQFPEVKLDVSGVITICPAALSDDYGSNSGGCKHPNIACTDCRREFWMQEIE